MALGDYRMKLQQDAHSLGHPLTRHMILVFPEDQSVRDINTQFMVGTCLLVAPVITQGDTTVKIYFPQIEDPNNWIHVWSEKTVSKDHEGTWVTVEAPIGKPAVYVRTGSDCDSYNLGYKLKNSSN